MLDALKGSDRELNELETDEFIPISYAFFKAAEEGTANRNLKLLSKLVRDELEAQLMSFDHYSSAANVAKTLTIEEVAALSIFLKRLPEPERSESGNRVYDIGREHFQDVEKDIAKAFPRLFANEEDAIFALSSLAGKGVLVPVIVARVGLSFPMYFPSQMALRLAAHAESVLIAGS